VVQVYSLAVLCDLGMMFIQARKIQRTLGNGWLDLDTEPLIDIHNLGMIIGKESTDENVHGM